MSHSPGCLSLAFIPLFCYRPALRSALPKTQSNPCTTDGSGSIHHRDLWSIIAGKWTRAWAAPRGGPRLIFFKSQKEKGEKGELREAGGEDGGVNLALRNIFKVAIWAGWDFWNCLSILNKNFSLNRRNTLHAKGHVTPVYRTLHLLFGGHSASSSFY